jgi:hypothetical protein
MMVFSPLAHIYQEEYWSPVRLGGWTLGLEDAIVSFSLGSLIWLASVWRYQAIINLDIKVGFFSKRLVALCFTGGLLFGVMWAAGVGAMTASILTHFILAVIILILQKELLTISIMGALVYTPFYCVLLYTASLIVPDFFSIWSGYNQWGPRVGGLPLEDIVWAGSLAASFPLVMAYTSHARLANPLNTQ